MATPEGGISSSVHSSSLQEEELAAQAHVVGWPALRAFFYEDQFDTWACAVLAGAVPPAKPSQAMEWHLSRRRSSHASHEVHVVCLQLPRASGCPSCKAPTKTACGTSLLPRLRSVPPGTPCLHCSGEPAVHTHTNTQHRCRLQSTDTGTAHPCLRNRSSCYGPSHSHTHAPTPGLPLSLYLLVQALVRSDPTGQRHQRRCHRDSPSCRLSSSAAGAALPGA